MALVSGQKEIHLHSGKCFPKPIKREDWEEPLWFPGAPSLGIWRTLERLVRGLKVPEALKYVTVSFPMSWLFAVITETRRILVLFRGLHLLELKIKNFSGLSFR